MSSQGQQPLAAPRPAGSGPHAAIRARLLHLVRFPSLAQEPTSETYSAPQVGDHGWLRHPLCPGTVVRQQVRLLGGGSSHDSLVG